MLQRNIYYLKNKELKLYYTIKTIDIERYIVNLFDHVLSHKKNIISTMMLFLSDFKYVETIPKGYKEIKYSANKNLNVFYEKKKLELVKKFNELVLKDIKFLNRKLLVFKSKFYYLPASLDLRLCKADRISDIPTEIRYYDDYPAYLESDEWKTIRNIIIAKRKVCEVCMSSSKLEVHHLHYFNIFNEREEDLQLLCARCHGQQHGIDRN